MSAVTDRRRAFAWLDLGALDRIDAYTPDRVAAGVQHVYSTLCRVAARRYDGEHAGFEVSRSELAAVARVSTKTIDRHVAELERLGLVEVERQAAANGSAIPSRYVLVDPPAEAPGLEVAPPETSSPQGGDTGNAAVSPPTCARPEAVKKEEEREREGERAPDKSSGSGENSDVEQGVTAALAELLAERGEQLTARQRLSIRGAVSAAPAGVDVVASAARLRKNYGIDGKAARQPIGDVVAVLLSEIRRSTPTRSGASSPRRGRAAAQSFARSLPAAADAWRIHDPRRLDPPDRHLTAAWKRARRGFCGEAGGYWSAILEQVLLAGVYETEIEDRDGTHQQSVIVVQAPADVIERVAETRAMRTIVAWLEDALGEENIIVELSRTAESAAVAA